MLTDEIFWKMDLECIYSDGVAIETPRGFYVYLIVNDGKYYVGLSERLNRRIIEHIKYTNNNWDKNACVYILEKFNYEDEMRIMESVWIVWFLTNTDSCINIQKSSRKIRKGIINKNTIWSLKSKYNVFCDFEYIKGIKLLDKQSYCNPVLSEIEYFVRTL